MHYFRRNINYYSSGGAASGTRDGGSGSGARSSGSAPSRSSRRKTRLVDEMPVDKHMFQRCFEIP